jgi:argininosuccinate synthase
MRILLAYSGDLTTTTAIPWLRDTYQADVITATVDLGQGRELELVRDRALAAGASRAHVLDARDQFARDFILPSLKADALHDGQFVMAVALSRPLIARKLVEIAAIERVHAVAHGAPGRDTTRPVLDVLIQSLDPALKIIAVPVSPPRDLAEYAKARGIMPPLDHDVEANLWGRSVQFAPRVQSQYLHDDGESLSTSYSSHEPGQDASPSCEPPAAAETAAPTDRCYAFTRHPAECPDEPAVVNIAFDHGIPKAINGVFMPLLELIDSLGTIARAHGVGRVAADGRLCEAPAAVLLHAAHRQLQAAATAGDLQAFARAVSLRYVDLVCDGRWFTPLREALDAFVDKVQERVTGDVRLDLFKGNVVTH